MARAPELVLEEAARAAAALKDVIEKKPRKVVLNGKTYLQFEDWQTLGRFYGITAVGGETKIVNFGRVQGFEAHADALLIGSNQKISHAEAMCLDDEPHWNTRPIYKWINNQRVKIGEEKVPSYQLRSMAQTRACAKALRNVLAWIVVLAGYAPTPAEEMDRIDFVASRDGGGNAAGGGGDSRAGISHARREEMCMKIANAPNREEVRKTFTAAYSEASAAKDRAAHDAYIAAKDARLRELR